MLFNSLEFLLFLPIVFLLYWFAFGRSLKGQNAFVVVASYVFYGWWDWHFMLLIAFTTLCSWVSGVVIGHCQENCRKAPDGGTHLNKCRIAHVLRSARFYLWCNILLNLGILGYFKYFNFFVDSFVGAFARLGITLEVSTLQIILPVGISFYTFQALSYSIDVYRRQLSPTRDVVAFFAYVSFFPQLVAGPIERATHLLPQFLQPRSFDYNLAVDGCRQMLWGFFKKIVIADGCAEYVNLVFGNSWNFGSAPLFWAAILFSFQIYADFSGYSDIAIGCAKCFGIRLMQNFNLPYFSRDIAEFWRRWHISLTTWFRDYIYIPLGGSRVSKLKVIRNTFVIFLVSGFWHGANWTYVAWGAYHAMLFLPLILMRRNRRFTDTVAEGRVWPSAKEWLQMLSTFVLTVGGWILFRSQSLLEAKKYIRRMINFETIDNPSFNYVWLSILLSFIAVMLGVEWSHRNDMHGLQTLPRSRWTRWAIYVGIVIIGYTMYCTHIEEDSRFIYFQF